MAAAPGIRLDLDPGDTLARTLATLDQFPTNLQRAQARAMKRLLTWVQREILRELSAVTGATQNRLKALVRYRASPVPGRDAIEVWIGTNPIKVHHLGAVTWRRRMTGARVGRKTYPGTWAWTKPKKTAPAVMRRTGTWRGKVETIEPVTEPIHDAVTRRVEAIQPRLADQLERYMLTALREQIYKESKS
jgi:hypothetical protein